MYTRRNAICTSIYTRQHIYIPAQCTGKQIYLSALLCIHASMYTCNYVLIDGTSMYKRQHYYASTITYTPTYTRQHVYTPSCPHTSNSMYTDKHENMQAPACIHASKYGRIPVCKPAYTNARKHKILHESMYTCHYQHISMLAFLHAKHRHIYMQNLHTPAFANTTIANTTIYTC